MCLLNSIRITGSCPIAELGVFLDIHVNIDVEKLISTFIEILSEHQGLVIVATLLFFITAAIRVIPKIKFAPIVGSFSVVVLVGLGLLTVFYLHSEKLILM